MKTTQMAKSVVIAFIRAISCMASAFVLLGASLLFAQTNLLDNSFGTKGTQMTAIAGGNGSDDEANAIAIQPDSKIVVAGKSKDAAGHYAFALARYNTDGTLDNTFGTNGTVRTALAGGGMDDEATSLALQPDGKIVVAGFSEDGFKHYAFAVARYNPNGTLGDTFGTNGEVRTAIAGGSSTDDRAFGVAFEPNGDIAVVGMSVSAINTASALAMYNSNGTLNGAFGTNGTVRTVITGQDAAFSASVHPGSKILVGGLGSNGYNPGILIYNRYANETYWVIEEARYNPDGTLDNSFGSNGVTQSEVSYLNYLGYGFIWDPYFTGNFVLQNGESIVTGVGAPLHGGVEFFLVKMDINGAVDQGFGNIPPIADSPISGGNGQQDDAFAAANQSDGKMVVVGSSQYASNLVKFAIARFDSNGMIDSTFGIGGSFSNSINGGAGNDVAYCVTLQPNGQIVAAGKAETGSGGWAFGLARYGSGSALTTTQELGIIPAPKVTQPISLSNNSNTIYPSGQLGPAVLTDNLWGLASSQGHVIMSYLPNSGLLADTTSLSQMNRTGGVAGYPEVSYGYSPNSRLYSDPNKNTIFPMRLGQLAGLETSGGFWLVTQYTITPNSPPNPVDFAYDIWITKDSVDTVSPATVELMVWLYNNNLPPAGVRIGQRSIPCRMGDVYVSRVFDVYANRNDNGSVTISFVADTSLSSVNIGVDISAIVSLLGDELQSYNNSVWSQNSLNSFYVSDIELGSEFKEGLSGSANYTFIIWNYHFLFPANANLLGVVKKQVEKVPEIFNLYQNYPNPFNPSTTINFALKQNSNVDLSIFNVLGQRVQEFDLGRMNACTYSQTVDISRFASGVYFYRLEAMVPNGERFVEMKKMVLIK